MCKRTRPNYGDTRKLEALVQRLNGKECIQVGTMGSTLSWPDKFVMWLNHAFPCKGTHTVLNLGKPGLASDYWEGQIMEWKKDMAGGLWKSDMIVVETALEDYGLENPQFHVEGMIRELLGSPKKPVLVWAACGWKPPSNPNAGHEDALLAHLPLLQYYNVEQVSLLGAFLPLHRRSRQDFLAEHLSRAGGLTDLGQQMCAQVLGNALLETKQDMEQHTAAERQPWFEEDLSAQEVPQRLVMNKKHRYFEEMLDRFANETDEFDPRDMEATLTQAQASGLAPTQAQAPASVKEV